MTRQAQQFRIIAGLTARESIRQPVCLLLLTACLVLTALAPVLIAHQMGEEGKLARDTALAVHFVFGLLIGGYAACTSLSRETRSGTAATILSKSVSREVFFLAKFAGVAVLILIFSFCALLATLLSDRIAPRMYRTDVPVARLFAAVAPLAYLIAAGTNYVRRRHFVSSAFGWLVVLLAAVFLAAGFLDRGGHPAAFGAAYQWRIVPASLLITLSLLVLAALSLSLAVRLATAAALAVSAAAFLLGLMSDYVFGRAAAASGAARILYGLIPNLQHFWLADALTGGGAIPWGYVGMAALYAGAYTAGILLLGVAVFRHSDIA
jgi:hypothetical protein